jgi:hypothetical protein
LSSNGTIENAIASASGKSSGTIATIIGIITLIVTASGRLWRNAHFVERDLEGGA